MRFCKRNAVHGVRLWMKSVGLKGFTTPADNRGVMSWESWVHFSFGLHRGVIEVGAGGEATALLKNLFI